MKDIDKLNKAVENLRIMEELEKRVNCSQCDRYRKEIWNAENGDFICVAKLKNPIKHIELGLSKDNTIRKCVNIKGVGCRVEEMDWIELSNICVLGAKLLKRLNKL